MGYSATSGRRYRAKKCICIKIQRCNSLGQIVACRSDPGQDLYSVVDAQVVMCLQRVFNLLKAAGKAAELTVIQCGTRR